MTEVAVRPAEARDAGDLARLSAELARGVETSGVARRLEELLADGGSALRVAEIGGAIVGWIHVLRASRITSDSFAEIGGLVVTESMRGRGVGRALVVAAERWAAEQGLPVVRVRSNVARTGSHPFYERLGYRAVKSQRVYAKKAD